MIQLNLFELYHRKNILTISSVKEREFFLCEVFFEKNVIEINVFHIIYLIIFVIYP